MPEEVAIGEGPQTSEWINAKGILLYSNLLDKIHNDFWIKYKYYILGLYRVHVKINQVVNASYNQKMDVP
jgi:hypothetical protein